MKNTYIISFAALMLPVAAEAQNLNPTVSVTRDYEGKLVEIHKPMQTMAVPDSLLRFDLDFDYSVFDNPYRGAYDFKPYVLEMRPQAEPYTGRKLYLKAGAGYQLRPYLDFVWEPQLKTPKFKMDVYASHRSYVGKYSEIGLDGDSRLKGTGNRWNGYDMLSAAGVNGRADLDKAALYFDAGYRGIHTRDAHVSGGYNAAEVSFGAKSENASDRYLYYDVSMKYRFAAQGPQGIVLGSGGSEMSSLDMNDVDFNATLGPVLSAHHRVVADFGLGMTSYGGMFTTNVGTAYITPKYMFCRDRWRISAGPKISFNISGGDGEAALNTNKGILLYPDVHVGFEVVRNYMNLYFKAEGGDYRNPYMDMKEKFHFLQPYAGMSNNSVMHADFAFGFDGNIRSRFRYDVRAGFRSYEAMPFDIVSGVEKDGNVLYSCGWDYLDGTAVYSEMSFRWESRAFRLDSRFNIMHARLKDSKNVEYDCFEPSLFSGCVSGVYNWKKRIFAGVSAEFATKRDGSVTTFSGEGAGLGVKRADASIPAWADVCVYAEYAFTRKMSFWLRGDNLLNMEIQRTPLYTDGGIGFTAGICLNL